MKKYFKHIVAIILIQSVMLSLIGVEIYYHECSHTGMKFASLSSDLSCEGHHENCNCCSGGACCTMANDYGNNDTQFFDDFGHCINYSDFHVLDVSFDIPNHFAKVKVLLKEYISDIIREKLYISDFDNNFSGPFVEIVRKPQLILSIILAKQFSSDRDDVPDNLL